MVANKHLSCCARGTFFAAESAASLQGGGVVLTVLLLGLDIVWAIFVISVLIEAGYKRL